MRLFQDKPVRLVWMSFTGNLITVKQLMSDKQSDFLSQLFDTISSDPALPAELKVSLLRLQLPIHTLSQTDHHFFSNARHPARRILFIVKRISQFTEKDPLLISKVDLILSSLIKSTPNAVSFSQANQRLETLLKNIAPAEPEPRAATSPEASFKQQFNHKIKLCIQGHQIPANCKQLVLKLWPNALLYLFKTHGEDSPHWLNALETYCDLLKSIQPISNIEQYRQLKDNYMRIARNNNNTLLNYHAQDIVEAAIKSLIAHFNQMLGSAQYTNESSNQRVLSTLDKISSLPASIKPGVWCEIYIDDITPPRRLRLSLINIETGMLMFVNRKGVKKIEKDAYEFSQELKNGLSRVYKHDSLFSKPSASPGYQKIG